MNKRQVKKLALKAKTNVVPYLQTFHGGSKKLLRRRKALFRYNQTGGQDYDRACQLRNQATEMRKLQQDLQLLMVSALKFQTTVGVPAWENYAEALEKLIGL